MDRSIGVENSEVVQQKGGEKRSCGGDAACEFRLWEMVACLALNKCKRGTLFSLVGMAR
jgi:hypothetical protein